MCLGIFEWIAASRAMLPATRCRQCMNRVYSDDRLDLRHSLDSHLEGVTSLAVDIVEPSLRYGSSIPEMLLAKPNEDQQRYGHWRLMEQIVHRRWS